MRKKHLTISIDGPAGAGKTTIAFELSKRLNILYLSTGALYRALGLKCKNMNLNPANEIDAKKVVENTQIDVKYVKGSQRVILDYEDVTDKLYSDDISSYSSTISSHKCVREFLISLQRSIADKQSVIMDGRDIGSVVLPNANFKFYLDANEKERAKRRYAELKKKGISTTLLNVLKDIKKRDYADSHREISPLKVPENATVVDSTNLDVNQVVQKFLNIIGVK